MATYEPEDYNSPEENDVLPWPEMDMIENIIMDIKEFVKDNKSGAHITIDIDFKTINTPNGTVVGEKYAVGAASINPTPEDQKIETKKIDNIILSEMESSVPDGVNNGLVNLPPSINNASIEDQMKYIADQIARRDGASNPTDPSLDGLKDDFFSMERLMEYKKRTEGNGKQ
jgi:hypothetical protein